MDLLFCQNESNWLQGGHVKHQIPAMVDTPIGVGTVKFIVDDTYHLLVNEQLIPSHKAVSCLLKPQIDDMVQILFHPQHPPYILAVLARENTQTVNLDFGLEHEVVLKGKHVRLEADESIDITTSQCRIKSENTHLEGKHLNARFFRMTTVAEFADQCFETITFQATRSFNWVKQLKHSVIATMRTIVRHTSRTDCEQLEIHSKNDAKIKAKQIHLG